MNADIARCLTSAAPPQPMPCYLLDSGAQYQRAEPQQDSFSPARVGFSCSCSGHDLLPPGPRPAGGRKRYATKRGL